MNLRFANSEGYAVKLLDDMAREGGWYIEVTYERHQVVSTVSGFLAGTNTDGFHRITDIIVNPDGGGDSEVIAIDEIIDVEVPC